jgi:hypothetical protein
MITALPKTTKRSKDETSQMNVCILLTAIFLMGAGCSFKNPDKAQEKKKSESLSSALDSDGDGISDANEISSGTDPFIADLPSIQGKLFNELNVEIDFLNNISNRYESLKWNFKNEQLNLDSPDTPFDSPVGSLYMETLLKSQAFASGFKRNDFRFYDYNESIFSFSSPQMKEEALTSISEKILSLKRRGFNVSSADAVILNKFTVISNKYTSYRKPLFDIFYKSNKQEALIYLDSKELDGTYTFNSEHEIYIDYQSINPEVIFDAFINGGSRFFIKLRDFTIYETGQKYSELLKGVQSKSVPITISYLENDGLSPARIETIYVGLSGKTGRLDQILKTAFKDNILMAYKSIDQIGGLYNRERSFGDSGKNETLKWFIGAEYINESIFDHDFRPNEGIGLAYFSDKRSENIPLYLSRDILTNEKPSFSGKLPINTNTVKIRIVPILVQIPYSKVRKVTLPHCGNGAWETDEVYYDQTLIGWANQSKDYQNRFLEDGYIKIQTIKGTLVDGNLAGLVKRKFLSIKNLESGVLELEFQDSIIKSISNIELQISVEISLSPTLISIQNGAMNRTGQRCVRAKADPPRGGESGRGGGGIGLKHMGSQGMGFSEERVGSKYDLDVHFISY